MILQDPTAALNPVLRIGTQTTDVLRKHLGLSRGATRKRALLEAVRIREPEQALRKYPHELSGGMRQRVGIARATSAKLEFVVADEIVSGLDVSVQARILDLLRGLCEEMGLALLFISHDLAVVRALCGRVLVTRDGRVVEEGDCADLFAGPRHAYTRELLGAIPLPRVEPGWLDRD